MPKTLFLSMESPSVENVNDIVDHFFDRGSTKLSAYPAVYKYEVVEVRSASDGNGGIHHDVLNDILIHFYVKDARIEEQLAIFSPYESSQEHVLAALADDSEDLDGEALRKKMWHEAFLIKGQSMSYYRTGLGNESDWAIHNMEKAFKLMGPKFHADVGYWDIDGYDPSLFSLEDRVKFAPDAQWVATVRLEAHNMSLSEQRTVEMLAKTNKELTSAASDLAEYVRDLCAKHHSAPFAACETCSGLLERVDTLLDDDDGTAG